MDPNANFVDRTKEYTKPVNIGAETGARGFAAVTSPRNFSRQVTTRLIWESLGSRLFANQAPFATVTSPPSQSDFSSPRGLACASELCPRYGTESLSIHQRREPCHPKS